MKEIKDTAFETMKKKNTLPKMMLLKQASIKTESDEEHDEDWYYEEEYEG